MVFIHYNDFTQLIQSLAVMRRKLLCSGWNNLKLVIMFRLFRLQFYFRFRFNSELAFMFRLEQLPPVSTFFLSLLLSRQSELEANYK